MPAGSYKSAAIILLTDGRRTTGPDPIDAARMAAERGVRVYTVGFGTAEGAAVSFDGWSIYMRFDEEALKGIADVTKASYFHAKSSADLVKVYEGLNAQYVFERTHTEIAALFVAVGGVLDRASPGRCRSSGSSGSPVAGSEAARPTLRGASVQRRTPATRAAAIASRSGLKSPGADAITSLVRRNSVPPAKSPTRPPASLTSSAPAATSHGLEAHHEEAVEAAGREVREVERARRPRGAGPAQRFITALNIGR